jgi:hypothetical protein
MSGCDREKETRCLPGHLIVGADSITLNYNSEGRLVSVKQYDRLVLNKHERTDEFAYNDEGQIVLVTRYTHPYVGNTSVLSILALTYISGLPAKITGHFASGARIATDYAHDEMGRLTTATTTAAAIGSTTFRFAGSTRYEYDGNGNIPKVYYTILRNQVETEVLARENTSFDDHTTFYNDLPDLRLYNNYINSYLPNQNNCLSSVIYYYSYTQRYTTPQNVSFEPSYYDNGMIYGLVSNPPAQRNFSGDVLFTQVSYDCQPVDSSR